MNNATPNANEGRTMQNVPTNDGKIKAYDYLRTLNLVGLPPAAERLIRAIAFFTYEAADAAIPGWEKLCRRAKIQSRDTLARHLATLEQRGLITRQRRSDRQGKGRLRDKITLVGYATWRKAKLDVKVVYTYVKDVGASIRDKIIGTRKWGGLSPIIGPSIYSATTRYGAVAAPEADHGGHSLYDEPDFQSLVGSLSSTGMAA